MQCSPRFCLRDCRIKTYIKVFEPTSLLKLLTMMWVSFHTVVGFFTPTKSPPVPTLRALQDTACLSMFINGFYFVFLFWAPITVTTTVLKVGTVSFKGICITLRWQATKTLQPVKLLCLKCRCRVSISFPEAQFSSSTMDAAVVYADMKLPEVVPIRSNRGSILQPGKLGLFKGILLSSVSVEWFVHREMWAIPVLPSNIFTCTDEWEEEDAKSFIIHHSFIQKFVSFFAENSDLFPTAN